MFASSSLMKKSRILILILIQSSFCFGAPRGEDAKELNAVRAERKATLELIVAQFESGIKDGTSGVNEFIEAKIDLHEFERDCESTAAKKLIPQQKIVELEEQRHSLVNRLMRAGDASSLDFLRSKERALAAKQLLLELKTQAGRPSPQKAETE